MATFSDEVEEWDAEPRSALRLGRCPLTTHEGIFCFISQLHAACALACTIGSHDKTNRDVSDTLSDNGASRQCSHALTRPRVMGRSMRHPVRKDPDHVPGHTKQANRMPRQHPMAWLTPQNSDREAMESGNSVQASRISCDRNSHPWLRKSFRCPRVEYLAS